jgi:aquaglyceroporin related protein
MDIESNKQDSAMNEKVGNGELVPRTPIQDSPKSAPYSPKSPVPYAEHGPLIDRSQTAEGFTKRAYNAGLLWPRVRHFLRAPFAEFMGTFILVMFGDGVVAQVTLSEKVGGDYQSISWGWVSAETIVH